MVNTLNEEQNLPYALRSVRSWADEIVVVDMHSEDRTVEIANEFGAKVHLTRGPGFEYAPRAFAVEQATNEWVFVLDADELATEGLCRELEAVSRSSSADAAFLPRTNYLLGKPLTGAGWGPDQDAQLRFFKKRKMIASSLAHQDFRPTNDAKVTRVAYDGNNAIVHFNYLDTAQFIEKLNRYTTIEAQQAYERGERAGEVWAIYQAAREFLNRYLRKKGYRDGWRGLYLSGLMAMYRWTTQAKLRELESTGGRDAIAEFYRREAEKVIGEYGKGGAS